MCIFSMTKSTSQINESIRSNMVFQWEPPLRSRRSYRVKLPKTYRHTGLRVAVTIPARSTEEEGVSCPPTGGSNCSDCMTTGNCLTQPHPPLRGNSLPNAI